MASGQDRTNVAVWGFYDQGNLGDDVMAILTAELIRKMGMNPVIISCNSTFYDMGYDVVPEIDAIAKQSLAGIILGGGAFFKAARDSSLPIEKKVQRLATFLRTSSTPMIGLSLGSDGVSKLSELSPARRQVLESHNFKGTTLRLRQDEQLGVPNASYAPDIVLTSSVHYSKSDACGNSQLAPDQYLINLTRRATLKIPLLLWHLKGKSKSLLVSKPKSDHYKRTKVPEIVLPFLPVVRSERVTDLLEAISRSKMVYSSKLHAGVISLSFGGRFYPVAPRKKTVAFISEYEKSGILLVGREPRTGRMFVTLKKQHQWLEALYEQYATNLLEFKNLYIKQ